MPPTALAHANTSHAPLPRCSGRFSQLFQAELAALMANSSQERGRHSSESVYQAGRPDNCRLFRNICERLLLPGSGLSGLENLIELAERAEFGEPGMILSWHGSNLDAPNLNSFLSQSGRSDLFDRLVFVAGRKLDEESATSRALTESFTRVVVTPQAGLDSITQDATALGTAKRLNLKALRSARSLLREGRLLFLFPTGTRYRDSRPETGRALRQVDGYLRLCKNFVVLNTAGNALLPIDGCPLIDEYAEPALVRHSIGPVTQAASFRQEVRERAAAIGADPRGAIADAVMEAISSQVVPGASLNASRLALQRR